MPKHNAFGSSTGVRESHMSSSSSSSSSFASSQTHKFHTPSSFSRFSPSPSRSPASSRERCSPSLSLSPPPSPPLSSRPSSTSDFHDTLSTISASSFSRRNSTFTKTSDVDSSSTFSTSSANSSSRQNFSSQAESRHATKTPFRTNSTSKTDPINLVTPELPRSNNSSLVGTPEWDNGLKQSSITSHFLRPSMSQPSASQNRRSRQPLNFSRSSSSSGFSSSASFS